MNIDNPVTRALALLACIGFLLFGLVRVVVGGAMLAQVFGYVDFPEFAEAIVDTAEFLAMNAERSIIAFSVPAYFGYIVAMGLVLFTGAIGALRRKPWGVKLIGLYLAMHAALFVNYLTINPKIWLLMGGIALLILIAIVRKPRQA